MLVGDLKQVHRPAHTLGSPPEGHRWSRGTALVLGCHMAVLYQIAARAPLPLVAEGCASRFGRAGSVSDRRKNSPVADAPGSPTSRGVLALDSGRGEEYLHCRHGNEEI